MRAYSVKTPECPFEEITILTAYRENDLGIAVSAAKTLEALKRRTRELGGDALLGLTTVPRGENVRTGGLRGTAVRFTDPSCNMDEPATPEP